MRVSATSCLAAAGLIGALLFGGSATAQAPGQPRQLFPQDSAPSTPSPLSRGGQTDAFQAPLLQDEDTDWRRRGPATSDFSRPGQGLIEEPRILRGGILVDELDGRLPETSGILEPSDGGLGLDLWQGSDRDDLIRLIRVVPDNLESPALRGLAQRLLLSTASPPMRGAGFAAPGELLRVRAERLYALGAHEELLELLQRLPRDAREDPLLARLHVESGLLTRERAEACRVAAAGIDRFQDDAFWQEALIYCQISEGQDAAANLGLSLLREAGDGDQQVLQLAEAALGYRETAEARDASALALAYLDTLDEPPSSGLIERAPYAFLGVLARQLTLPIEERLPLAERAVQFGLLEPRLLAEAYERRRFDAAQLDDPVSAVQELEGSDGRALLYKGAWRATSAEEKLELLEAFLAASAVEDLSLAALQVSSDLLLDVHPDQTFAAQAPLVVQSLLVTGRLEQASAWTSMLRNAREQDEQARAAFAEIWPVARVAGLESDAILNINSWARSRAETAGAGQLDEARASLQLLIDALEGRDEQSGGPLLSRVGGAAPPSPSALYALQGAVAADQRGEAALLVLQLLGGGTPGYSHPQALGESLAALTEIGLRSEARAIAVESLLVQKN